MPEQVAGLDLFADEVRADGFRHVVLLGMGGSSLGPMVLSSAIGHGPGAPEFIVLDSTVPATVKRVTDAIEPAKTLFLVSSKSAGTAEPNALYRHFRPLVAASVGEDDAGQRFAAVTDEGTSLETLAHEHHFRAVFLNPSDIGGRYSVLSYFGLVPAALMGLDADSLLERAAGMSGECAGGSPGDRNPGVELGAAMGSMALAGRDKLTLITSRSIETFGLWVEQLIAESTGKEGKGIVPVAGEPMLGAESYGDDRFFVYMRLDGDDNDALDAAVKAIELSDQPVFKIELDDPYDLGAEFFRWEFATAVAGSVLGINPFDQPDVELAKQRTTSALEAFESSGRLPEADVQASADALLSGAGPGDYLAIMAFIDPTDRVERSLTDLRRAVGRRYRIASTMGYGPRFLHSTGQLHKGGPSGALCLQMVAGHSEDVEVPGEPHTFGVLVDAQALGDLAALQARGRRVARIDLGPDPAGAIAGMAREIAAAVS